MARRRSTSSGPTTDSLYGSRHLAERWAADNTLGRIKALINVDMIGDKDLDIMDEQNSSPALRKLIWSTAQRLGYGKYFLDTGGPTDDALLKAVAYGWNQEKLARNAHEISVLGKELHDRLRNLAGHITAVGTGLDRAVEAYNKAVGSLESRVLVSARKFTELGAPVAEDIPELAPIETTARALSFDWDEEPPLLEASEDASEDAPTKNQRKAG